jgi:hypothetical protein
VIPSLLADLVLLVHFAFVVFVAVGAFLVAWRRWVAWLHVPCALYGAAIEFFGWVCPLTPLENRLRRQAGQAGYTGGFIENYLEGILYPAGWSDIHLWLGAAVVVGNAAVYGWIAWRSRRRAGTSPAGGDRPGLRG